MLVFLCVPQISISQTKKEIKEQKSEKEYKALKELLNSKIYVFDADWLSTSRGRRINVAGGSNSLAIVKDSTKAAMQFFGEVTSIRFNNESGVAFNNAIQNYELKFNDKKRKATVSFNVKNDAEYYTIFMSINKNGYAFVDVYSNRKSNVTYDGVVSPIIKQK